MRSRRAPDRLPRQGPRTITVVVKRRLWYGLTMVEQRHDAGPSGSRPRRGPRRGPRREVVLAALIGRYVPRRRVGRRRKPRNQWLLQAWSSVSQCRPVPYRRAAHSPIPEGCKLKCGQRVFGSCQGSFADKVAVNYHSVLPLPKNFSFEQGAGKAQKR